MIMPYGKIAYIGQMTTQANMVMTNKSAFIDLNNVVYFCGNALVADYTAGSVLATLPSDMMFPLQIVVIPVCVKESDADQPTVVPMTINTDGTIEIGIDLSDADLYLSGVFFTTNSRYYTPEIGNVYPNNTSPLA